MLDQDVINLLHWLYWNTKVPRKDLENGDFPYVYSPDTLDDLDILPIVRRVRGHYQLIDGYTSFMKAMESALTSLPSSEHFFSYPVSEPPRQQGEARPAFLAISYARGFGSVKNAVVKAAAAQGFECDVTGDRRLAGNVMDQVWQGIRRAEFVVADITGFNPNVMIEVGFAVSLGKPVLIISQDKEMPFDVRAWRRHVYDRKDLKGLRSYLEDAFREAPRRYPMDNPWWTSHNQG